MTREQKVLVVGTVVVLVSLVIGALATMAPAGEDDGKVSVVASFYPLGYLVEEIGGEHVTVRTLVPENSELHAWQPSPSDIVAADDAEVLVYNGAGLDPWFEDDILGSIDVGDAVVVETTRDVDLLEADGTAHDHGEDDHDHEAMDPHTWIEPYVAMQQAEAIYDALVEADPDNAGAYSANWDVLRQRLLLLHTDYLEGLNDTEHDVIIVTHSAFGYLAHRYGFEQHGVIGLSADEQPSAAAIADLADEMVELGIFTVFVDPVYSDDYARTLRTEVERETGETVAIVELYFMVGEMDGLDYMDQMERNLENLKAGLGAREEG